MFEYHGNSCFLCNITFFHKYMVVLFFRARQPFVVYYGFSRLFLGNVFLVQCISLGIFVFLYLLGEAGAVFGPTTLQFIYFFTFVKGTAFLGWSAGGHRAAHGLRAGGTKNRLFALLSPPNVSSVLGSKEKGYGLLSPIKSLCASNLSGFFSLSFFFLP